jgi:hypothetical protein
MLARAKLKDKTQFLCGVQSSLNEGRRRGGSGKMSIHWKLDDLMAR